MTALSCFKTYDVRGAVGSEINEALAYRIGRAFAQHFTARRVAVGRDSRLSGEGLKTALARGLMDGGADVIDIGLSGTEEIYFASFHLGLDGGIEVTASHNPVDHNGFKFVGKDARSLMLDDAFAAIKSLVQTARFPDLKQTGRLSQASIVEAYTDHLLGYTNVQKFRPLRLVVDAGNGVAGHVINALERRFLESGAAVQFIKINHEPDGRFPNGVPNPLLPERRTKTQEAVRKHQADLGIAWDGDFDRCFIYDETGTFVSNYYLTGLLAEICLAKNPGGAIICDSKLYWNTWDQIHKAGGIPIKSRTGHVFFKEKMREHNAIYGGEISGHHYFRDFAYCDSGMIPWLLVAGHLGASGETLGTLISCRKKLYACSEEINFTVQNPKAVMASVLAAYEKKAQHIERIDGLGLTFENWRLNLRQSNTETLLRLNLEARGSEDMLNDRISEIKKLVAIHGL